MSFTVAPGEVLSFIGPNGSGKTTTIRLILGLYARDGGRISVFTHDPARRFSRIGRRLGVMLEQPGLSDDLTAQEYLEFCAGLLGLMRRRAIERAGEVLGVVGLAGHGQQRLRTFSKGMRQRVAFARAILNRPELLVLDEPFDGIDNESRRHLLNILPAIAREHRCATFVTSHNLGDVDRLSDRIAIINRGHIVALDSATSLRRRCARRDAVTLRIAPPPHSMDLTRLVPQATYDRHKRELTVQLLRGGLTRDGVIRLLLDSGLSIEAVEDNCAGLEDAYFELLREDNLKCGT